ncbi:MAG TPA: Fe-S cluster assembly protein SufD [Gammaproteobacteria bacterium]
MSMQDVTSAPFADAVVNEYDVVAPRLPGQDVSWLAPVRKAALKKLQADGFPSRRNEHWKYTDITPLLKGIYTPAPLASAPETFFQGVQRFELDCHRVVFVNGVYRKNLSDHSAVAGLQLRPLVEVLAENPQAVEAAVTARGENAEGFSALNTAYLHDGVFIELDNNAVIEKPIHLIFLSVAHEPDPVAANPRIIVQAGENSEACLLESHLGLEGVKNFTNLVADISLAQNSKLRHLRLIEAGNEEFHIANIVARVNRDARYDSHQVCLGGKLVRNDVRIELLENNASTDLNGFVLADGSTHIDNHLDVRHIAPHTNSSQCYRAVLDGRSRCVFNGKVHVAPDAQKIDAKQASNNLLLSKLAEIDTKPELEIYADDVKCAHGATVGQLDENMLFYLRSRGIDAETARALLIFAFADDVIRRVGIPEIRSHVEDAVLGRLPDTHRIKEFVE